jgi:hypothetical protein
VNLLLNDCRALVSGCSLYYLSPLLFSSTSPALFTPGMPEMTLQSRILPGSSVRIPTRKSFQGKTASVPVLGTEKIGRKNLSVPYTSSLLSAILLG